MTELTEERVREIARDEILKREMEKIRTIAEIDALVQEQSKGLNENENQ